MSRLKRTLLMNEVKTNAVSIYLMTDNAFLLKRDFVQSAGKLHRSVPPVGI